MNRNRIIDKTIEVAIGIALTSTVAVLSGLRKDINKLNDTMIMMVERLSSNEKELLEQKAAYKDLENRVRIIEILTEGRRKK